MEQFAYFGKDFDFGQALKYAFDTRNHELFDALLKAKANAKEEEWMILLKSVAMSAPSLDFFKKVIRSEQDLGSKDQEGNTLLHYAAASSCPELVKYLIEQGLAVDAKGGDDMTPLLTAAQMSGSVRNAELLIEAGADMQARDSDGDSLILQAAGFNPNEAMTRFFLDKGFSLEDRDNNGLTPLLAAVRQNESMDVIRLLCDAGADIRARDNDGNTVFHLAAYNQSSRVAWFFKDDFLTSEHNNAGETCMEFAIRHACRSEVMDVYFTKMREEHTMLAFTNPNLGMLESLLEQGYSTDVVNSDGVSALMLSARSQQTDYFFMQLMLHRNFIWNNRDCKGRTVLHYAAVNPSPAIYDFMRDTARFEELLDVEDSLGHTAEYYRAHPDEF
ncbi:MAG: ankyrin repeat domain-containing protein [Desulfovibrio sp.]|nr:ankyrin repeat domain-containing protein [Desulfovibrio sp.]